MVVWALGAAQRGPHKPLRDASPGTDHRAELKPPGANYVHTCVKIGNQTEKEGCGWDGEKKGAILESERLSSTRCQKRAT